MQFKYNGSVVIFNEGKPSKVYTLKYYPLTWLSIKGLYTKSWIKFLCKK